ncbi:hypothetical protein A2U01_0029537 [Trifolium medium]|uniref:Uncharacterized protein n=1 Tax=Trifolium medium TaxID=97028 RepID=A0A392PAJ3_9FABA|nr:hypothetical protein [Trifolium medium]
MKFASERKVRKHAKNWNEVDSFEEQTKWKMFCGHKECWRIDKIAAMEGNDKEGSKKKQNNRMGIKNWNGGFGFG